MTSRLDRRVWVVTDRPEEQIAVGSPLPGVHLMSARRSDRLCAAYHTDFDICLLHPMRERAGAFYRCRGTHAAGTGELMAFEPGDHHVTTAVSGGKIDFSVVGIAPEQIRYAAAELGLRGEFHLNSVQFSDCRASVALHAFVAAAASGEDTLELECRYADFLRTLIESCAESPPPLQRVDAIRHFGVRTARNYLRENFYDSPSLAELARIAGLSRYAFAHAFTRYVGLSPHAYLKLRRACEARRLVEQGMPIGDVADRLGYVDVPFLTRTLRDQFGAPPGRWRRCFTSNSQGVAGG